MQPDNNKYILKDITEELNQLENKQIINGFVYQNSIPLAYVEGQSFVELKNSDFKTDIISRLNISNFSKQEDLNKIDESDEKLIQECIDNDMIEESNVKNIKNFLTNNTLDDLKVLNTKISGLSDTSIDDLRKNID